MNNVSDEEQVAKNAQMHKMKALNSNFRLLQCSILRYDTHAQNFFRVDSNKCASEGYARFVYDNIACKILSAECITKK